MTETLRIGWWNTSLAVRKGNARRKAVHDPTRLAMAGEVVKRLSSEGVHVLVLGESLFAQAAALADATSYTAFMSPSIDDHKGITVLYDKSIAEVSFRRHVRGATLDDDEQRSLEFVVEKPGNPPIMLIASHWPARGQPAYEIKRKRLGTDLQLDFKFLNRSGEVYVMYCGDFNDDPFNLSLTECLQGTRDRNAVRKDGNLLYNPFWRLLGEREHHEHATGRCAGTYYWRGGDQTQWYTFDQFLFSRKFVVDGGAWQLLEAATQIWDEPPLRSSTSGLLHGFDHFPVIVSLRENPNEETLE